MNYDTVFVEKSCLFWKEQDLSREPSIKTQNDSILEGKRY